MRSSRSGEVGHLQQPRLAIEIEGRPVGQQRLDAFGEIRKEVRGRDGRHRCGAERGGIDSAAAKRRHGAALGRNVIDVEDARVALAGEHANEPAVDAVIEAERRKNRESSACRTVTFFSSPMNAPAMAGSGMRLRFVPRTSSSSRSLTGTGWAKVSVNVRLSRSAAGPRSSSWVSGSVGIRGA